MQRVRPHRRSLMCTVPIALLVVTLLSEAAPAYASTKSVIADPDHAFSFTLPANWKQVPLNSGDVTSLLNAATHDDPALTNALNGEVRSAAAKGLRVFALGPVNGSSVPNVNVIVTSSAGAPPGSGFASALAAEAKIELTEADATHIKTTTVHDRLGSTAQATYELDLPHVATQYGEQLYALHQSHIEIVTVTTSNVVSTKSIAHAVATTWRW